MPKAKSRKNSSTRSSAMWGCKMWCMLMHALHGNHDGHQPSSTSNESLLEILKRRYALGEINDAQFEQLKRTLGVSSSAQANAPTEHPGHSTI
ncbi:MAG: SHOCT domain-containing protein [Chloroflexi bacterium]|nr:SHOCT domain-containing protein [Chloroflexota bacterium]MBI5653107.1 SHOCT domain-containing protein [Chloroflexota bacterium]